jgi:hypothetical protein
MALYVCIESFQGTLPGVELHAVKGQTILDSTKPKDAAMLKAWGIYFAERRVGEAKPAEAPKAEPTPEPAPEPAKRFGLSNARLREEK